MATEDGAKRAVWYSNSRPMHGKGENQQRSVSCRRFIYVGHIRPYKGIAELIEAAEKLNSTSTVDVYGPFYDGFSEQMFNNCKNLKYGGLLSPKEVVSVMKKYDALVMPTKMPTEGYPGAIVEAFAAGIPILATKCGAIPEIVDDSCGILVEPKDSEALFGAMKTLVDDDTLYARLCEGSRNKRESFSAKFWTAKFVEYCRQVNIH
jgi:glycosyltransferase involved in cell wall biosynthesis